MTEIRYVSIDGISYPVVLSDETEALLKAKADGKASVGFWDRNSGGQQDLSGASYLVEDLEDTRFLKELVSRTCEELPQPKQKTAGKKARNHG